MLGHNPVHEAIEGNRHAPDPQTRDAEKAASSRPPEPPGTAHLILALSFQRSTETPLGCCLPMKLMEVVLRIKPRASENTSSPIAESIWERRATVSSLTCRPPVPSWGLLAALREVTAGKNGPCNGAG